MSLPKIFLFVIIFLTILIGSAALLKKGKNKHEAEVTELAPVEIKLEKQVKVVPSVSRIREEKAPAAPKKIVEAKVTATPAPVATPTPAPVANNTNKTLPEANRIEEFFNRGQPKFPFVETITYQSRIDWQKGRPAWLSDYASHYQTSRHFIARSLNGKVDYLKQDVSDGDRFNVLSLDKNINFYLLIDTTRSKMWFYAIDTDTNERTLIKTYQVGLGRLDSSKTSGSLTPWGKYLLGSKIAIYKPKMMSYHNGAKVEMIRIFGTRWIPFEKEVSDTTAPAKGFGIHGVPWVDDGKGSLAQDDASIGKYESDGCIRLATSDMEEIFAIVITKPTYVELVKDFFDAKLPGAELR